MSGITKSPNIIGIHLVVIIFLFAQPVPSGNVVRSFSTSPFFLKGTKTECGFIVVPPLSSSRGSYRAGSTSCKKSEPVTQQDRGVIC